MKDSSPQSAYSTRSLLNVNVRSSNNKADKVVSELKQFAIALKILRKYPDAFNEFKQKIGDYNHPEGGPSTDSNRLTEEATKNEFNNEII